jgi:hypothetical protein
MPTKKYIRRRKKTNSINKRDVLRKKRKTKKYLKQLGGNIGDDEIKEWLALENIATKDFEQEYLEPRTISEKDNCEQKAATPSACTNDCDVYTSTSTNSKTCVTKSRIKKFRESPTLKGKNGKTYNLKEAVLFEQDEESIGADVYYYIFESTESGKIYILFPTGIPFKKDEYTENPGLKAFLQKLINKLTTLYSNNTIIICGHSMGCVLSLYTGRMIKEENSEFFNKKVKIIGSAPFKHFNDGTFSELNNVKIFVIALRKEKEKKIFIDCYVNDGVLSHNYQPLTYVEFDFIDGNYCEIVDNIHEYKIDYFTMPACSFRHSWITYYKALKMLYPF